MGHADLNLAALVGSRICHDLISPVGAINNGLELLEMAGSVHGPELDLIADSVENAGARIRCFRIAYGAAGEEAMSPEEINSVLADLTKAGRWHYHWDLTTPQPRRQVQLAFLAMQCCETAMPFGGEIRVALFDSDWVVAGGAQKVSVDAPLWDDLRSGQRTAVITPALVQFALLNAHATDAGLDLRVDHDETQVAIRF